jgi:bilirubin oxidase
MKITLTLFPRNDQLWPYLNVEPRKYRFRLLTTSVSRGFRLYLVNNLAITEDDNANHIPFYVVGFDAGRTSQPVRTTNLWMSMADRWEIVIDFAPYAGKSLFLKNYFVTQADVAYNSTNQVMKFNVGTMVTDNTNNGPLPAAYNPLPVPAAKDLSKPDHIFRFERRYKPPSPPTFPSPPLH